jgi:hypothetical protein
MKSIQLVDRPPSGTLADVQECCGCRHLAGDACPTVTILPAGVEGEDVDKRKLRECGARGATARFGIENRAIQAPRPKQRASSIGEPSPRLKLCRFHGWKIVPARVTQWECPLCRAAMRIRRLRERRSAARAG